MATAGSAIHRHRPRRISGQGMRHRRAPGCWPWPARSRSRSSSPIRRCRRSGPLDGFVAQADVPTVAPGDRRARRPRGDTRAHHAVTTTAVRRSATPGPTTTTPRVGTTAATPATTSSTRDLVDKTYVSTSRCPNAVATGTLHDPYTNETVAFVRGEQTGAAVQIDHIVPLAYAWDLGARNWPTTCGCGSPTTRPTCSRSRARPTRTKATSSPPTWMPPNRAFWCQYAVQFVAVLRGYRCRSTRRRRGVLRDAAATCPTG